MQHLHFFPFCVVLSVKPAMYFPLPISLPIEALANLNKTRFPLKSVAGRAKGRAIGRSAGADRFAEAKMTELGLLQEPHGYGYYAGEGINVHSGKKVEQNRESIFPRTERKLLHTPIGFMRSLNLESLILPQRPPYKD
ncbi:MAG: hypothetical protein Q8O04_05265, partial [Deltaproteobacteria bacterium]|nr:hypothetical protein [Deltaproteobacteria bacterium]